jgi:hypothetical protein
MRVGDASVVKDLLECEREDMNEHSVIFAEVS